MTRNADKKAALDCLKYLTNFITVLPFEAIHINEALHNNNPDFEDSIQYYIAKQNGCNIIISRNIKHYKKFDIPVLTAEQFLRTLA